MGSNGHKHPSNNRSYHDKNRTVLVIGKNKDQTYYWYVYTQKRYGEYKNNCRLSPKHLSLSFGTQYIYGDKIFNSRGSRGALAGHPSAYPSYPRQMKLAGSSDAHTQWVYPTNAVYGILFNLCSILLCFFILLFFCLVTLSFSVNIYVEDANINQDCFSSTVAVRLPHVDEIILKDTG